MRPVRIAYIERRFWGFVSIEKVFRAVAGALPERFTSSFTAIAHGNSFAGIVLNLLFFKPPPDADIYHVTGHIHYIALRLPPERTVLTIHDLGFLVERRRGLRGWLIRKLFLDWPIGRMRYVTAISEYTRDLLIAETGCDPGLVRLVENPLPPLDYPEKTKTFNTSRPVILQVGALPNKNLPRLAAALKGLPCLLRIVGEIDPETRSALDANGVIYETFADLSDDDLARAYVDADIVAFCSVYEGFGLPVIEAQAAGTPVVTSRIRPLAEVSGGSTCAMLADPFDPADIRRCFDLLMADEDLRTRLVSRGFENAARFRPALIAGGYAGLYDEISSRLEKDSGLR